MWARTIGLWSFGWWRDSPRLRCITHFKAFRPLALIQQAPAAIKNRVNGGSSPHTASVDLAAEHDAGLRLVHAVQLAYLVEQGVKLLVAGAAQEHQVCLLYTSDAADE